MADRNDANLIADAFDAAITLLCENGLGVVEAIRRACSTNPAWSAQRTMAALAERLGLDVEPSSVTRELHSWEGRLSPLEVFVRLREIASGLRRE